MVALLACGALGWWAFVRGVNVPLLSLVDLKELSRDSAVHPALRDQARALLEIAP